MTITKLLQNKQQGLLNIYITAGFPRIDSLTKIIPALEHSGVDIVEIGLPYSDPISDGPTIQQSNKQAIKNGINIQLIFEQLKNTPTTMALLMMGYFNSIYHFGIEDFCKKCKEVGVSGLIIPDLPIDVFTEKYMELFDQYDLSIIFLITPETAVERIRKIDSMSHSFIYAVSSSSTTGQKKSIHDSQEYLLYLKNLNLKTPFLVGFHISTHNDFEFVKKYSAGAIIGSAFIKHIKQSQNLAKDTTQFIKSIKQQTL